MRNFQLGLLWATQTGMTLHASATCCNGSGRRIQVKDHFDPSHFGSAEFELCPEVETESSEREELRNANSR